MPNLNNVICFVMPLVYSLLYIDDILTKCSNEDNYSENTACTVYFVMHNNIGSMHSNAFVYISLK